MKDDILTIEQVANLLSVSKWLVYKYIRDGKMSYIQLSPRRKRILKSQLHKYIQGLDKIHKPIKVETEVEFSMSFFNKHGRFPLPEELESRTISSNPKQPYLELFEPKVARKKTDVPKKTKKLKN